MTRASPGRAVVQLHPCSVEPIGASGILHALDNLEDAARDQGLLYVDVELQVALARHLAAVVGSIRLGSEPSVAQVHAIRELRFAVTELRELVDRHARRARR